MSMCTLFYVVTITLLCSWVLSLTMTPLMCVQFIVLRSARRRTCSSPASALSPFLAATRHPWRSPSLLSSPSVGGHAALGLVPGAFFPDKDQATFTAELELPIGTPIERTAEVVDSVEEFIADELVANDGAEGIVNWGTFLGEGPPRYAVLRSEDGQPRIRDAADQHDLPRHGRGAHAARWRVRAGAIPGCEADASSRGMLNGPPITDPIEIRLSGAEEDEVFALADEVKAFLAGLPGVKSISTTGGARTKKMVVRVDQPRARRAGVTSQDVALDAGRRCPG